MTTRSPEAYGLLAPQSIAARPERRLRRRLGLGTLLFIIGSKSMGASTAQTLQQVTSVDSEPSSPGVSEPGPEIQVVHPECTYTRYAQCLGVEAYDPGAQCPGNLRCKTLLVRYEIRCPGPAEWSSIEQRWACRHAWRFDPGAECRPSGSQWPYSSIEVALPLPEQPLVESSIAREVPFGGTSPAAAGCQLTKGWFRSKTSGARSPNPSGDPCPACYAHIVSPWFVEVGFGLSGDVARELGYPGSLPEVRADLVQSGLGYTRSAPIEGLVLYPTGWSFGTSETDAFSPAEASSVLISTSAGGLPLLMGIVDLGDGTSAAQ